MQEISHSQAKRRFSRPISELQGGAGEAAAAPSAGRGRIAKAGATAILGIVALTGASAAVVATPVETEAATTTQRTESRPSAPAPKVDWGSRPSAPAPKVDWGSKREAAPAPKVDWGSKREAAPAPKVDWGSKREAAPAPKVDWGSKREAAPAPKAEEKKQGIDWGSKREAAPVVPKAKEAERAPGVLPGPLRAEEKREGIKWGERKVAPGEVGKAPGGGIVLPKGQETKTEKREGIRWGDRRDDVKPPPAPAQPAVIPQHGWNRGQQVRIPEERIRRIDPQPVVREKVVIIRERHIYHDDGWGMRYGDAYWNGFFWGSVLSRHDYYSYPVYVISPVTGQSIGQLPPPTGQDPRNAQYQDPMEAQLAVLNIMAQEQKGADGNFDAATGLFGPDKDNAAELGGRLSAAAAYNMLKRGETVYFHSAGGSNEKLTSLDDLKVYLYTKGDAIPAAQPGAVATRPGAVANQHESHTGRNILLILGATLLVGGAVGAALYLANRQKS